MKRFSQVLEDVESLTAEEQENLISILQRRLREQRRTEIVKAVKEAREEHPAARIRPSSPGEIMKKILS